MSGVLNGLKVGFQHAIENPFGLNFEVRDNKIYVPLGSVINCLGYNDFLERIIGVVRVALALVALAVSEDKKDRFIAAGHIFRGFLEMMGTFELYLLIADAAFTAYNVFSKILLAGKDVKSS